MILIFFRRTLKLKDLKALVTQVLPLMMVPINCITRCMQYLSPRTSKRKASCSLNENWSRDPVCHAR